LVFLLFSFDRRFFWWFMFPSGNSPRGLSPPRPRRTLLLPCADNMPAPRCRFLDGLRVVVAFVVVVCCTFFDWVLLLAPELSASSEYELGP
jgi:hypothetical protein